MENVIEFLMDLGIDLQDDSITTIVFKDAIVHINNDNNSEDVKVIDVIPVENVEKYQIKHFTNHSILGYIQEDIQSEAQPEGQDDDKKSLINNLLREYSEYLALYRTMKDVRYLIEAKKVLNALKKICSHC